MEPFREVRSPERNYGPARLPGGTVVTPLARRLAGEAGIDLANIKGSGPHGRIVAADVEGAKETKSASPAPTQLPTAANIVLTADVGLAHALTLCAEVPAIELADIIIKAWAATLARMMPSEPSDVALIGKGVIRNAASQSLTAIAAARRAADATQSVPTAISMPNVAGITSIADVLRPPHSTMLGIGAARRAPVEAADGSLKFADAMTVTLTCDPRVVDGAMGAALLSAFKGFVERPVTMLV